MSLEFQLREPTNTGPSSASRSGVHHGVEKHRPSSEPDTNMTNSKPKNASHARSAAIPGAKKVKLAGTPHMPTPQPRPAGRALETVRPETLSPYIIEMEVNCDECGGSGFDPGSIDPWGPEVCPTCHGAKTQTITRNYLAEAFQISANPDSIRPVERQHLVAVIQHCRELVGALMSFPEVA
jgi:hypothetical protein